MNNQGPGPIVIKLRPARRVDPVAGSV
jgi:hypothetical protein